MRTRLWRWNRDRRRWESGCSRQGSATHGLEQASLMYVPRDPAWRGVVDVSPGISTSVCPVTRFTLPRR